MFISDYMAEQIVDNSPLSGRQITCSFYLHTLTRSSSQRFVPVCLVIGLII